MNFDGKKMQITAMLGQYFGFGVAEEWRIQSAFWEGPEICHSVASIVDFHLACNRYGKILFLLNRLAHFYRQILH